MTLSRRQRLALLFLAHSPWSQHWTAIDAVLRMHGERQTQGRVTACGLVRRGLAMCVCDHVFRATEKGRAMALLLKCVDEDNLKGTAK